ncbi:hypothetical protein [Bradyrhizobium sp. USDA 3364]
MPPDLGDAPGEVANRHRKIRRLRQRAFLVDQILPIQRKQHLRDAGQRAIGAAGDVRGVAARQREPGILDAEPDFPLKAPRIIARTLRAVKVAAMSLDRNAFPRKRITISSLCWSMIFSENRFPLFRIML